MPPPSFWFHSHRLPDGTEFAGLKPHDLLAREWEQLRLPSLAGKSVLDIGAWDGYFSFRAEAEGAARVLAMDHYVWSMDIAEQQRQWHAARAAGVEPPRYERAPAVWRPGELPGKHGFDFIHALRNSRVEQLVADFMTVDPVTVGSFDFVFFLGVLYHMQDPLGALRRVALFARELAVIETEAIFVAGLEDRPMLEFFPGAELNGDVSNWYAPNLAAVRGLCKAAGFRDFVPTQSHPREWNDEPTGPPIVRNYRLTGHAVR